MTTVPEKIKRFRTKGTEIRKVKNNYYLYRVKCFYDSESGKRRKKTLAYLGRITEEGVIPPRHRDEAKVNSKPVAPSYSKEYGATWLFRSQSKDIYEKLQAHFGVAADWIYVTAILRAIKKCAFKNIEHYYETSYISEVFKDLPLSSASISNNMALLGINRVAMVKFMREFIPSDKFYAIFDGTSIICNSQNISEAQRGYNSHGCHDPQINLMYAVSVQNDKITPVFYKNYPGSIRDVSAFKNMLNESGIKTAAVLADKGFYSAKTADELSKANISYVMPLRRNSTEYETTPLQSPGVTGFEGRFLYNGRVIWYWSQPVKPGETHRYFLYLDETLQHREMMSRMNSKIGNETEEELRKIQKARLLFGTFALKTTLMEEDAVSTYKLYKLRESIEQLFDTYKSDEGFQTTGMHSKETMEATFFINHLSTVLIYRLYEALKTTGMLNKYSASGIGDILWDVRVSNAGGDWQIEPVPKCAGNAIDATGNSVPEQVV